ncbi:PD-(D/E)XK nuclease family protein [Egibacter rhizosphaerae]|uniref:PD-(D/E)XK nuclease family protein n=1 Tax=Egibacter rhizosphaerae TaxID=1670831 RepID=A0A411YAN3_9ACTN|nr:PD-(D/E)XK nuclease family protein [Egibacter rhizosphaerae]QBI18261.1 PD-(D/E)XK nuclease family protein [Egibacter rhizosphaerae]
MERPSEPSHVEAPTAATPTGAAAGPASGTTLLGEPVTDEPLRLSFSRVDTYRRCPRQYRYAYIDKLPQPPSPHLSFGSSVHGALERWWDRKLPDPPPLEELLQALYDAWDTTGFAGMEREEQLRWYTHARDVLARHHARFAEHYVPPVAVEQWFEVPLPDDIVVVGSIDLVVPTGAGTDASSGAASNGLGIIDWKTNRRAKTREQVAGDLQLAIYALAARHLWGHDPDWVALDFVVPGMRVTVPREEIDVDAAVAKVRETAARIRSEAFEPQPSRLCAWCDFRTECPAGGDEGPDLPGVAVGELRRLKRRQARDARRIDELKQLVADRLGPDALVELDPDESS